jgi:hypothetical protein
VSKNNTFSGVNTFTNTVHILGRNLIVNGIDIYQTIFSTLDLIGTLPQLVYSPIYSSTAIYPYVADIGEHTMTFYSYDVGSDFLTISLKQQTDPSKGTGHAIVLDIFRRN